MIRDPQLQKVYFIVDALDECTTDLWRLLQLIDRTLSEARVKWIVSSRNDVQIGRKLRPTESRMILSLELKENSEQISDVVRRYIDWCLSNLPEIYEDISLRNLVQQRIH